MAKEINLVPDIKDEFIKALKFRNFVFFLCIVVSASSLIVMLIFLLLPVVSKASSLLSKIPSTLFRKKSPTTQIFLIFSQLEIN